MTYKSKAPKERQETTAGVAAPQLDGRVGTENLWLSPQAIPRRCSAANHKRSNGGTFPGSGQVPSGAGCCSRTFTIE